MQVTDLDFEIAAVAARLEREGRYARTHNFVQHGGVSVYEHCVRVAALSCRLADAFGVEVDKDALIRGALLHDYFLYDWHEKATGCTASPIPARLCATPWRTGTWTRWNRT